MNHDPSLNARDASGLRAELQARADMLDAAGRDLARQKHCAIKLEAALARWLLQHRLAFGDAYCVNALLARLPEIDPEGEAPADRRLRRRVAMSRALRPAVFRAIAARRDRLGTLTATDAQLALRVHTRAYARMSDDGALEPQAAAAAALDEILRAALIPEAARATLTASGPRPH